MLKPYEELWEKELPQTVEELLTKSGTYQGLEGEKNKKNFC
jgi:hypothetical protein